MSATPTHIDQIPSQSKSLVQSVAKFAGLSGAGWLLDFFLLLALVRFLRLPVFTANLISASTAGLFVFLASRKVVFRATHGNVVRRAIFYLAYTIAVILLASCAMRLLVDLFHASGNVWLARPVIAAALAKILVTPANLALNFVVARGVNEFGKKQAEIK